MWHITTRLPDAGQDFVCQGTASNFLIFGCFLTFFFLLDSHNALNPPNLDLSIRMGTSHLRFLPDSSCILPQCIIRLWQKSDLLARFFLFFSRSSLRISLHHEVVIFCERLPVRRHFRAL
jgi:hypothetical protein